jgi:hypothetical protein
MPKTGPPTTGIILPKKYAVIAMMSAISIPGPFSRVNLSKRAFSQRINVVISDSQQNQS